MYILLRKGKDFYYECAGRCTEKPPDDRGFYDYEHACFTLDGQVLSLNKRMRPSLIAYIQQTIKNNHETFRKEIDMATKTIFETKSWTSYQRTRRITQKERPQTGLD